MLHNLHRAPYRDWRCSPWVWHHDSVKGSGLDSRRSSCEEALARFILMDTRLSLPLNEVEDSLGGQYPRRILRLPCTSLNIALQVPVGHTHTSA